MTTARRSCFTDRSTSEFIAKAIPWAEQPGQEMYLSLHSSLFLCLSLLTAHRRRSRTTPRGVTMIQNRADARTTGIFQSRRNCDHSVVIWRQ